MKTEERQNIFLHCWKSEISKCEGDEAYKNFTQNKKKLK